MIETLLSWAGAITSFIGMGISVFQSAKAHKDRTAVEKYASQIQLNLKMTEFSSLIEKGKIAKNTVANYTSKTSKTNFGLTETRDIIVVQDFFTAVNEKKHLVKKSRIEKFLTEGKKYLSEKDYGNLLYSISDILAILSEKNDGAFLQNVEK